MSSCTTEKTVRQSSEYPPVEVMEKSGFMAQVDMYKKFFFERKSRKPKGVLPQVRAEIGSLVSLDADELRSIWLGHSTMLLRVDGHTLLTDPVFEPSVSIVGPTRFNRKLPLDVKNVPELDAVLISHDHYDHLNKFSIRKLANRTKVFLVPEGVGKYLKKWGVEETKIREVSWWEPVKLSDSLTVWGTPVQHFSGRGLFDRNSTGWNSYAIVSNNHRAFFSGDSGYFAGFQEIGKKFGPFDATFIECGAYDRHWAKIHMFPEQTVQAHLDLQGKVLHPIHWGTFDLALHPWYEPMERVMASSWDRGVTIATPIMGRLVDFDRTPVPDPWWERVIAEEMNGKSMTVALSEY